MTATTPLSKRPGARGVTVFTLVLAVLLAAFFTAIAAVSLAVWMKNGHIASLVSVVTPIWLTWAALCFFALRKIEGSKWTAAAVFVMALIPRLSLVFVQTYTPTSDFLSYWQMGQAFLQGDKATIAAVVDHSRVVEFAGVGIWEGLMQAVSGQTTAGYQCLQGVITSGIAVLAYLLGGKADKRVGLIAAALYALYPSNLVLSQVFTNQHLATFLALTSVLIYLRAMEEDTLWKSVLLGALAGLVLLLSHYEHPSSIVTRVAFVLYAVLLCFQLKKQIPRILCALAACLVLFTAGNAVIDRLLLSQGYRLSTTRPSVLQEGILTGLTDETDGLLDSALREEYRAMTDTEARAAILEKFTEPVRLMKLFARKALKLWGAMDSSFVFYTHESNETEAAVAVADGLGALDVVYVAAVYLLAALGLFFRRNTLRQLGLPALITAGWIGVYLVYEIQMRYRYYAMPLLMIFAALGIEWLLRRGRKKADA